MAASSSDFAVVVDRVGAAHVLFLLLARRLRQLLLALGGLRVVHGFSMPALRGAKRDPVVPWTPDLV